MKINLSPDLEQIMGKSPISVGKLALKFAPYYTPIYGDLLVNRMIQVSENKRLTKTLAASFILAKYFAIYQTMSNFL